MFLPCTPAELERLGWDAPDVILVTGDAYIDSPYSGVALVGRALEAAGFRVDHSEGSLYLWATRGEDCRATVDWLAERGILAAPGDFYGPAGRHHVRIALTASDERIAAAAARLAASVNRG